MRLSSRGRGAIIRGEIFTRGVCVQCGCGRATMRFLLLSYRARGFSVRHGCTRPSFFPAPPVSMRQLSLSAPEGYSPCGQGVRRLQACLACHVDTPSVAWSQGTGGSAVSCSRGPARCRGFAFTITINSHRTWCCIIHANVHREAHVRSGEGRHSRHWARDRHRRVKRHMRGVPLLSSACLCQGWSAL